MNRTAVRRHLLLPGRHHLLTRFQAAYLHRALEGGCADPDGRAVAFAPDADVLFAVTSANHANTRRNPFELHRREAAIERFGLQEGLRCLAFGIVDTVPTDRFAEVVCTTIEVATAGAIRPTPADTAVACSTPEVAAMYRDAGFSVIGVEADEEAPGPARPWTVLELLAGAAPSETSVTTTAGVAVPDPVGLGESLAHPASLDVLRRYGLDARLRMLFADPMVTEDAALTDTRDHATYARSFEDASARKWAQVGPLVRPGRIVDIGCATGGLLEQAGADARLRESDLFGIEIDRTLFAQAVFKAEQRRFPNPNTFLLHRNVLAGPAFPDASIDTTLTVALTHEITSYGGGIPQLEALARAVFAHTRPGGIWITADVVGPDDPDRPVRLAVATDDGAHVAEPLDLEALAPADVGRAVAGLSTWSRLLQFARDFPRLSGGAFAPVVLAPGLVELPLAQAMEFMTRKDYVDSWLSECHERFCDLTPDAWWGLLERTGFTVDPASHAWRNEWLVEHRFDPVARLSDAATGEPLPWPVTHVLAAGTRQR